MKEWIIHPVNIVYHLTIICLKVRRDNRPLSLRYHAFTYYQFFLNRSTINTMLLTKNSIAMPLRKISTIPLLLLLFFINGCSREPIELPEVCENYLMLYHQTREKVEALSHLSHKDQAYYHALFKAEYEQKYSALIDQFGDDETAMEHYCQIEGEELSRLSDEILFLLFTKKLAQ